MDVWLSIVFMSTGRKPTVTLPLGVSLAQAGLWVDSSLPTSWMGIPVSEPYLGYLLSLRS